MKKGCLFASTLVVLERQGQRRLNKCRYAQSWKRWKQTSLRAVLLLRLPFLCIAHLTRFSQYVSREAGIVQGGCTLPAEPCVRHFRCTADPSSDGNWFPKVFQCNQHDLHIGPKSGLHHHLSFYMLCHDPISESTSRCRPFLARV